MKKDYIVIILIIILATAGSIYLLGQFNFLGQTHFIDLAISFLNGRLFLPEPIRYSSWQDTAFFQGKYFVYFGPVPALLLIPLVSIFGQSVNQQILGILAGIINFIMLIKLAQKLGLKTHDAFWLSIAMIFGSVYLFLTAVNLSAYLVQVTSFTFLLAAILGYYYKKNWFIIGTLIALSGMTRMTLYFSLSFFLLQLILNSKTSLIKNLLLLVIPILISLIILAGYNQARFSNNFDSGYTYNPTWPAGSQNNLKAGLFSINNLPTNLYFFLIKSPELKTLPNNASQLVLNTIKANEWGLSIFITSPFLLWLIRLNWRKKEALIPLLATVIGIAPALLFANTGLWQFGYRYALDIYPFLFILLTQVFIPRGIPVTAKIVIIFSLFINFYYSGSIWNIYPK